MSRPDPSLLAPLVLWDESAPAGAYRALAQSKKLDWCLVLPSSAEITNADAMRRLARFRQAWAESQSR